LIVNLVYALLVSVPSKPSVDCMLVQNPPAVPLLIVSRICCWILGYFGNRRRPPGLVFDWHNLGYTMFDSGSTVQKWTKRYEQWMGPKADGHLTVTSAMKTYLQDDFLQLSQNDNIRVLYDCPPTMFRPLSMEEQHELLIKMQNILSSACPKSWYENLTEHQTLFTERLVENGAVQPRPGRPALITSSTSWTPDEDFGILLDALVQLETMITKDPQNERQSLSPLKILVAVTGKGPMKDFYEEKISKMKLENVAVQTLWLEPGDYPKILACADVGISLHTSTSGLDLPMKVLDLFGCATPVCALNFNCLSELVKDGTNGRVFETSQELADQLWNLLKPLTDTGNHNAPHGFGTLAEYSNNLMNCKRWSDNWKSNALPVLKTAAGLVIDE